MKDNKENYKKCKKEKDWLLETNDNLRKKNINAIWNLPSEKIISLNYKKNDRLLNLILCYIRAL